MDHAFDVAAAPEQVWPLVCDLRRTAMLSDPGATVTMDGAERPVAKGTVFQLRTGSGLKSTWTVTTWSPPDELAYHVDLGVFDGGTTTLTIESTPAGARLCLRQPLLPWPETWAVVRWATQPLVRRTARRQAEQFEQMLRAQLG